MISSSPRRRSYTVMLGALISAALIAAIPAPAQGRSGEAQVGGKPPPAATCPPAGTVSGFSDALDKVDVDGVRIGGLSSLAWDHRRGAWAATVDNHAADPARIWFFRNLASPTVVGDPLVLRRPDGTAYDGTTADNEGLVVLPDGRYVVSSETEPSIRIFGRDGVQQTALPVPPRFMVAGTTPAGQATANATVEGLTISPDGRQLVAAMEGALSGDQSAGDATWHRFLIYRIDRQQWRLEKQIAYRTEPGQRIPEVTAVGRRDLLVAEASFTPAAGNAVRLYLVNNYARGRDVTTVANLSTADRSRTRSSIAVPKRLVTDIVTCPSLGATSKQPQANPLLDNYEGMAVSRPPGRHRDGTVQVSLISDDNFSATQITRVLSLRLDLHNR